MKKSLLTLAAVLSVAFMVAQASPALADRIFSYSFFEHGFSVGDDDQLTTNDDGDLTTTATVQVGTNGTEHSKLISGTCNLTQSAVGSFTATSSKDHFCAVTGVSAGDKVFVFLPQAAGTASGMAGFSVSAAYASSSNMIGVVLQNWTGAATSSYAQASTSVAYWIVDN